MTTETTDISKDIGSKPGGNPMPIIFLAIVLVAIGVLWWQGALGQFLEILRNADRRPLLVAAPVYIASVWLLAVRWHQLVKMAQGSSNLPRASEAFLTSIVINYAAPIGLAVPSRAALTKKALGMDMHGTATIALWEVALDVLVLAAGTFVWLLVEHGSRQVVSDELAKHTGRYLNAATIAVVVVVVLLLVFFRTAEQRRRSANFVKRLLMSPRQHPRFAVEALVSSIVYWLAQGVVLALIMQAMQVPVSGMLLLGLTCLPILVGMLSPIPGGTGIREGLMYVVAMAANVPGAPVVAGAVVYRIALFLAVPILYAGVHIITRRHSPPSFSDISKGSI